MMGNARSQLSILIFLALLASQGLACLASTRVDYDQKEDFSQYRTWSWAKQEGARVEAPHRIDPQAIDTFLAGHIKMSMAERGYEYVDEGGDFLLAFELELLRRNEAVDVPMAPDLVSSYNSSASYWVEGSNTEPRVFDDVQLSLEAIDKTGRSIWRASLAEPIETNDKIPLEEEVSNLLERFPERK
jgi:hypothetical protein